MRALALAIVAAVACGERAPEPTPAPTPESATVVDDCLVRAGALAPEDASIALSLCREVAAHGVGGSVAIARDGALAFTWTAGTRCFGDEAPIEDDTAFRIGSITKAFVAATAVVLAHEGAIDLDTPMPAAARAELPRLPAGVTLRRLLDHTALLADALPDAAMRDRPRAEVLSALVRASGDADGSWRYANPGYALAGALLERATDTPWSELVRTRVLEPLALAHTRATTPSTVPAGTACGHLRDGEGWRSFDVVADWRDLAFGVDAVAPSGAAIASAPDLVRFALALSDRPPAGTPAAFAVMLHELRTRAVATGARDRYTLGVHVHALPGGTTLLRHAGNTGDFAADLAWVPERGFAVAVLGNSGAHLRGTLAAALARAGVDPRVLATPRE